MACEKFEDLLQRHFDDALSPKEAAQLQDHVKSCRSCRLDMKLYTWMFRAMRAMGEVAPPLDFTRSVMAVVRQLPAFGSGARSGFSLREFVWGLGVAVVALGVLGGVLVWQNMPMTPSQMPRLVSRMDSDLQTRSQENVVLKAASELRADGIKLLADGTDVQVCRKGTSRWQKVSFQTLLAPGDRIATADRNGARLVYPDQTWIRVKPNSTVQVLAEAIRVFYGDTWIKVEKRGSKFEALTPNAVASVRGTAYTAGAFFAKSDVLGRQISGRLFDVASPAGGLDAMAVLARALKQLAGARLALGADTIETKVQVYESSVWVRAVDPATRKVQTSEILETGFQMTVADRRISEASPLALTDYLAWNLPPRPELLSLPTRPTPRPASLGGPAAISRPTDEPVEPATVDLPVAPAQPSGPNFETLPRGR